MGGGGVLKRPFSTLTYAPSMGGKTEYWLRHLSTLAAFDPKPTHIHCFGHLNLRQFNRLKVIWGEDFVDVNYVRDLPGFNFVEGSFVLVDEMNSSIIGLKKQARETLLDSVRTLYNEKMHHLDLYVAVLCQEVVTTDCYKFLGITQSVCLNTKNYGKSMELVSHLKQSNGQVRRISAAMQLLNKMPEFLIYYHNPPMDAETHHEYAWACLGHYPHFSLAFGEQSSNALASSNSSSVFIKMDNDSSDAAVIAQEAFDKIRAKALPEDLKGQVFVYTPLESVVQVEEPSAGAAAGQEELTPEEEAQRSHTALNDRVLEMLSQVCSVNEFSAFRKFWYYLRLCPFIGINVDGTILHYKGRELNSLSFIRECCKKTPLHQPFGGNKPRKVNQVLRESVPYAAQLLKDKAFPPHLISNALLFKLASRYNQQR
jgi:hypothetical protein